MLKNEDDIISRLNEYNNILLTGPGAASIGLQCGGWTMEWQGNSSATLTAGVNKVQKNVEKNSYLMYILKQGEMYEKP